MNVVAFNGSPKKEGNTFHALRMVGKELEAAGIEMEIIHVGNKKIRGCMACNMCGKNKDEKCIFADDEVNEWIQAIKEADGILLGSPVHFSGVAGTMKAFLDRAFYVNGSNRNMFRHKVGASIAVVRRSGGIPTVDQLNKYIQYAEMVMPSANYWNVIHGTSPGDVFKDAEGIQIMKVLGKNMAWTLKNLEAGKDAVEEPERQRKVMTNFIR